eukprot:4044613-Prymnesium_polylepis.1
MRCAALTHAHAWSRGTCESTLTPHGGAHTPNTLSRAGAPRGSGRIGPGWITTCPGERRATLDLWAITGGRLT